VAPAEEVEKWQRDLATRREWLAGLPEPPPAEPPYPAEGEVITVRPEAAPLPRPLEEGWAALDLTAHANRSLVEDPTAGELAQFVTQQFEVAVAGGTLELTFHAEGQAPVGEFWVVNVVEVESLEGRGEWKFDFGDGPDENGSSPLEEGYERVNARTAYAPDKGFGWTDTTGLSSRDRERPAGDALRRDFVMDRAANADHTFRVDLPNGRYRVTVTMGDADFPWGPMSVLAGGETKLAGVQLGSPSVVQEETVGRRRIFFNAPGNDLRSLPVGKVTFNGVPFFILDPDAYEKSCLLFASRSREVSRLVRVEGIRVGQKGVAALHCLHAAGWNAPTGTPIGRYVAHYEDGTEAVQPIVLGLNIGSWWGDGQEHGPACEVAWVGDNPATRRWGTHAVLYQHRWANPHPDKRWVSLDVEGYWLACNPFVVAVTVEYNREELRGTKRNGNFTVQW